MRRHAVDAEGLQHTHQHLLVRRLVKADADTVGADLAEVQPLGPRGGKDARLPHAHLDRDRVEERLGRHPRPRGHERAGQPLGQEMHPLGDGA